MIKIQQPGKLDLKVTKHYQLAIAMMRIVRVNICNDLCPEQSHQIVRKLLLGLRKTGIKILQIEKTKERNAPSQSHFKT